MRREGLRKRMRLLVDKYESREVNKAEFCKRHGVSYCKLLYWIRKFKSDESSSSADFIPIASPALPTYRVIFPNGIQIERCGMLDRQLVFQLLEYVGKE